MNIIRKFIQKLTPRKLFTLFWYPALHMWKKVVFNKRKKNQNNFCTGCPKSAVRGCKLNFKTSPPSGVWLRQCIQCIRFVHLMYKENLSVSKKPLWNSGKLFAISLNHESMAAYICFATVGVTRSYRCSIANSPHRGVSKI